MLVFQPRKLAALRAFHDLDQDELARKTGLSRPTIQRLEHGDIKNPNLVTLQTLANFFEVSFTLLISDEALVLK